MMKFILECDGIDGLVLMDKSYMSEMNQDLLNSMDYYLDYNGKTELKYDFPLEQWESVRNRESNFVRKFCNSGKMLIYLFDSGEHQCEFEIKNNIVDCSKYLHIPTGELVVVNASELIQCALYSDMEMDNIFEIKIKEGWYSFSCGEKNKFECCYRDEPTSLLCNIEESLHVR